MIPGLLGTLSGGFRPTDIDGCVLWLDASQIVGLSDSDPVASWSDRSGIGNHGAQSTEAKRPLYKVTAINGLPAVRFVTSDSIYGTIAITGTTLTACAVCVMQSATDTYGRLLSLGSPPAADYSSTLYCLAIARDVDNDGLFGSRLATKSVHSVSLNTPLLVTSCFNGTNHTIWIDGDGAIPVGSTGTFGITDYRIGMHVLDDSGAFVGDVGEMLVYNSALLEEERITVEAYLATKWGITLI